MLLSNRCWGVKPLCGADIAVVFIGVRSERCQKSLDPSGSSLTPPAFDGESRLRAGEVRMGNLQNAISPTAWAEIVGLTCGASKGFKCVSEATSGTNRQMGKAMFRP